MAHFPVGQKKQNPIVRQTAIYGDNTTDAHSFTPTSVTGYTALAIAGAEAIGGLTGYTNLASLSLRQSDHKIVAAWNPAVSSSIGVNVDVLYVPNN